MGRQGRQQEGGRNSWKTVPVNEAREDRGLASRLAVQMARSIWLLGRLGSRSTKDLPKDRIDKCGGGGDANPE